MHLHWVANASDLQKRFQVLWIISSHCACMFCLFISRKKGFKDQDLLSFEHSISLSYPDIELLKSMVNCNNIDGLQWQSTLMAAAMEFSCKSCRWCRKLWGGDDELWSGWDVRQNQPCSFFGDWPRTNMELERNGRTCFLHMEQGSFYITLS
jgi:hypothetical protein